MPWFKVDDHMHDHRKVRQAGVHAMGLWLMAGTWSAMNLTDGFIPTDVLLRWDRQGRKLADRLVRCELWLVDEQHGEKGYRFHDWLEFQPHSEQTKADRKSIANKRREAGQRGAAARWNGDGKNGKPDGKPMANGMANAWQSDGKADGKPMAQQNDGPDPTRPVPLTTNGSGSHHPAGRNRPRPTDDEPKLAIVGAE